MSFRKTLMNASVFFVVIFLLEASPFSLLPSTTFGYYRNQD